MMVMDRSSSSDGLDWIYVVLYIELLMQFLNVGYVGSGRSLPMPALSLQYVVETVASPATIRLSEVLKEI